MCLVGRWRERENSWGPTIFSLGPPNYNLSEIERKQERNFCACEKNIWSLVLCYSFFLFFFPSPLHLFTLDFFSSSFILFLFQLAPAFLSTLLSSSLFSSLPFFFFSFFLKKIYLLASASSLRFYLFFFFLFFFFSFIL